MGGAVDGGAVDGGAVDGAQWSGRGSEDGGLRVRCPRRSRVWPGRGATLCFSLSVVL